MSNSRRRITGPFLPNDPNRPPLTAFRNEFLKRFRELNPAVIRDLRSIFDSHRTEIAREGECSFATEGRLWWVWFRTTPQLEPLWKDLCGWANTYQLRFAGKPAGWILEAALGLFKKWMRHAAFVDLDWEHPAQGVFQRMHPASAAEAQLVISIRPRIPGQDKAKYRREAMALCQQQIEEHIPESDTKEYLQGFRTRSDKEEPRHIVWLVLRLTGEPLLNVALDERAKETTVSKGVSEMARYLGLDPPRRS